jgi:hypothetical protein
LSKSWDLLRRFFGLSKFAQWSKGRLLDALLNPKNSVLEDSHWQHENMPPTKNFRLQTSDFQQSILSSFHIHYLII